MRIPAIRFTLRETAFALELGLSSIWIVRPIRTQLWVSPAGVAKAPAAGDCSTRVDEIAWPATGPA